jgi:hypothetical protein
MLVFASCQDAPLAPSGTVIVQVLNTAGQAVSGKEIEIVGQGMTRMTDKTGMAEFSLSPGNYVVRAYSLGVPGPGLPYVDKDTAVQSGEVSTVGFFDCDLCRAPGS